MKKTPAKRLPLSPLRISLTARQLKESEKTKQKTEIFLDIKNKKSPNLVKSLSSRSFYDGVHKNDKEERTIGEKQKIKIRNLILKKETLKCYLQREIEKHSLEIMEEKKSKLLLKKAHHNEEVEKLIVKIQEINEKIKKLTAKTCQVTRSIKMLVVEREKFYKLIKVIKADIVKNNDDLRKIEHKILMAKIELHRSEIYKKVTEERVLISELVKAIYNSDLVSLKSLVGSGIRLEEYVNKVEKYSQYLNCNYGFAVKESFRKKIDPKFYQKLISKNKELDLIYEFLGKAMVTDDIVLLEMLLTYGVDVNTIFGEAGINLLQIAIYQRNLPMSVFLLKKGANPDQKNNQGQNSLEFLYKNFDKEIDEEENYKFAKIIIKSSVEKNFHDQSKLSILESVIGLRKNYLQKFYLDCCKDAREAKTKTNFSYLQRKTTASFRARSQSI